MHHPSIVTLRRRACSTAIAAVTAALAVIVSLFAAVPAMAAPSTTATATGFNAENIISDALFYDGAAMTSAEIQTFLDAKGGACRNGKCLNVLSITAESTRAYYSQTTGDLVCAALTGGTMRVSEFIYRVQVACGISAKVILVTMQKEQGLVTSTAPSDTALRRAMGHLCSDEAPCETAAAGIANQIFGGAEQLKKYKATKFGKQPGSHFIAFSPTASCGGTTLNIRNYATAALYNYTPYQPNAASLAAGFGLGNSCSSYGNRNFYNYYTQWFGSTQAPSDPVGAVTSWELVEQGVRVRGWALDQDSDDSVTIRIKSGDLLLARATADVAGVEPADYPGSGTARGFDVTVALAPGAQTVCIIANNLGDGAHRTIGCREVTPTGGSPYGAVTQWKSTPTGVIVTGWVIDPDTTGAVTVRLKSNDDLVARASADRESVGLATTHSAYGTAHGFQLEAQIGPDEQSVCVVANNIGIGANRTLGCRTISANGGDPFGAVDTLAATAGGIHVRGWAIDPDTTGAVSVRVKVGTATTRITANVVRNDVAGVYPGYGAAHGFDAVIAVPGGTHDVCIVSNNAGVGANRTLGCSSVTVLAGDPVGTVVWTPTVAGVRVSGWVIDPDTAGSVSARIKVGGSTTTRVTADKEYSDLPRAYAQYGTRHGFFADVALPAGENTVCLAANNVGLGANRTLGCTTVVTRSGDPVGAIEEWSMTPTGVKISGWVIDPDTADPTSVRVKVGGAQVARVTADEERTSLGADYPAYGTGHGFSAELTLGAGRHVVCLAANNVDAGVNRTLACKTVTISGGDPFGEVTSWRAVAGGAELSGWAIDPDTVDSISVRVKRDDEIVTRLTADVASDDVATSYSHYGAQHGFVGFVALPPGQHTLCVMANNVGAGQNRSLGCGSVSVPRT